MGNNKQNIFLDLLTLLVSICRSVYLALVTFLQLVYLCPYTTSHMNEFLIWKLHGIYSPQLYYCQRTVAKADSYMGSHYKHLLYE